MVCQCFILMFASVELYCQHFWKSKIVEFFNVDDETMNALAQKTALAAGAENGSPEDAIISSYITMCKSSNKHMVDAAQIDWEIASYCLTGVLMLSIISVAGISYKSFGK